MCQGDTSLLTMRWGKQQAIPLANFSSPHQCVDWDRLDAWAQERSVDVFQPGMLVHPKFGRCPLSFSGHVGVADGEKCSAQAPRFRMGERIIWGL